MSKIKKFSPDFLQIRSNSLPRKGVYDKSLTEEELWRCKHLYEASYDMATGERMFILGRMCSQMPASTFLAGGMLLFYRSPTAVVFWQWVSASLLRGLHV